jgi:MYXO-CTERM domain-containing protein
MAAKIWSMALLAMTATVGCSPADDVDARSFGAALDEAQALDAAVLADMEARGLRPFMRPRAITLEVPWEHVAASGGRDSVARSPRFDDLAFVGPGQPPLKVFLNRNGGTYRPGQDDSRQNTSIVPRATSTIPAWTFGDARWQQLKDCVVDQFSRFNVEIVETEPPSNERYVEHVVGGRPENVGLPNGVGGVAPIDNFNCRVIDVAINYTFSEVYGGNVQAICETAAQEIAHSFSLDHELHCPDPMTYLGGCGAKEFRDVDAQCGEFQPRACNCNRASQNSVEIMFEKLGAAGSGPVEPPPPTETVPPVVSITSPADGATLAQDSTVVITASATDNAGIAATELVWDFTGDVFACPVNFGGGAVTCTRTGNVSTWNIRVGQGQRRFSVRARDTSGNVAETGKRTINLGEGGSTPPTDAVPPQATLTSPADGAVLPANATMQVVATANDDTALASVELLWNFTGDTFPCPFSGQAVSCEQSGNTFTWTLNVGVGLRAFQVRAIDTAGNTTITGERTVELSADGAPVNPGDPDTVGEPNDNASEAFGIRCGNALDLVVAAGDDDWFAIDAPAATAVQVAIASTSGNTIGLELTSADGQSALATSTDILADGGELRAVSPGPAVLARVSTAAGASSYRLTATCSQEGGDTPPEGTDDELEENDEPAAPTRAFCGQDRQQLIAADADFFVVNVRDGDAITVELTGLGVVATIIDGEGTAISSTGAKVSSQALPAGDFLVKVEPEGAAAYYDVAFSCAAGPPAPTAAAPCGCSLDGQTSSAEALVAGLVGLAFWRRRRRS